MGASRALRLNPEGKEGEAEGNVPGEVLCGKVKEWEKGSPQITFIESLF